MIDRGTARLSRYAFTRNSATVGQPECGGSKSVRQSWLGLFIT